MEIKEILFATNTDSPASILRGLLVIIHVVPGTHYMFSVGYETPMNAYQHAQNREIIVEDILQLHQKALEMQKRGPVFGKRRKAS